jgi:hypothetical protein
MGEYRLSVLLGHHCRECTPPYLSTGISNLLQPAQAEVVLGHLSTYLASWVPQHTNAQCLVHNVHMYSLQIMYFWNYEKGSAFNGHSYRWVLLIKYVLHT